MRNEMGNRWKTSQVFSLADLKCLRMMNFPKHFLSSKMVQFKLLVLKKYFYIFVQHERERNKIEVFVYFANPAFV